MNIEGGVMFRKPISWLLLRAWARALLRAPLAPVKRLGPRPFKSPPWALLRAWARTLLSAALGSLKGLGPGPLKGPPGPS